MTHPRKLMDDWEQASPPNPSQFMKMIFESDLFSPIQLQFITALMKKPGIAPPSMEAGMVPPGDPGVATAPGPGTAPSASPLGMGGEPPMGI